MLSARHWRESRVWWRSLVFWAWLASFVFGFAASDLLHAPNCPEQLALRAAHNRAAHNRAAHNRAAHNRAAHGRTTHGHDAETVVSQLAALHAQPLHAICLACLLQLGAPGMLAMALLLLVPLLVVAPLARPQRGHAIARALIYGARGPPARFI